MDLADNVEFRNRLVALAEVFDVKLSAARVALYFESLRDVSFERIVVALNQAVKACKFFPRPVELRTFALGDSEDQAEVAWLAFRTAMREAGSYASLSVRDAALGEAIVALFGGWPQACAAELTPEMWASKRKEFGRVYRVMRDRELDGGRYLPGICEQQNAGRRDWLRFVPVHRLEAGLVSPALSLNEAEAERTHLSVQRNKLTRLRDCLPMERALPRGMDETA